MDGTESSLTPPEDFDPVSASAYRARRGWWLAARLALMFAGVVLPVICFAIGYPDPPSWQSGSLETYAGLLLTRRPSVALYPFLLYNMTCMTLLVWAPARFSKSFLVRFGIYTGVLLALQYWILFGIALGGVGSLGIALEGAGRLATALAMMAFFSLLAAVMAFAVGWFLVFLVFLVRKPGRTASWAVVALLLVVLAGAFGAWANVRGASPLETAVASLGQIVVALLLACLFCSTPWAVLSYAAMAFYVARHSGVRRLRFSLRQLLGVLTWLAAYLSAWRTSVYWMLQEYTKLPANPPDDCYVCTAAARGHRRLVRAERQATACGRVMPVNDQMRYLKAGELLLASVCPWGHRVCRRIYNRIGPRLAARLVHPLLADAAYLLLKPAEWLSRATLALLLPGGAKPIRDIYSPPSRTATD